MLRDACGDAVEDVSDSFGDLEVTVRRDAAVKACTALRDDPRTRFEFLMALCGVDWFESREPRFEVVLHLYSLERNHRLRVIFPVPEDDPEMDTLTGVWKGANWAERECWEMFGIRFRGHPFLRRLLTHDDFQGHPLRKDYPSDLRHVYQGDAEMPEHLFDNIPGPRRPVRDVGEGR